MQLLRNQSSRQFSNITESQLSVWRSTRIRSSSSLLWTSKNLGCLSMGIQETQFRTSLVLEFRWGWGEQVSKDFVLVSGLLCLLHPRLQAMEVLTKTMSNSNGRHLLAWNCSGREWPHLHCVLYLDLDAKTLPPVWAHLQLLGSRHTQSKMTFHLNYMLWDWYFTKSSQRLRILALRSWDFEEGFIKIFWRKIVKL